MFYFQLLTITSEVRWIRDSLISAHWEESIMNSPFVSPTISSGHRGPSFFLIRKISKLKCKQKATVIHESFSDDSKKKALNVDLRTELLLKTIQQKQLEFTL